MCTRVDLGPHKHHYRNKFSEIFNMSSRIYCPYCGEKKREVSRSVENCIHCDKPLPACPECGRCDVGFIGVDLLGCYGCKTRFPPPEPLHNKGKEEDRYWWEVHWDRLEEDELLAKVTEEEFTWVTDFAKQLKPEIQRIPLYDPDGWHQGGQSRDPKLSYLFSLRQCIHIGPLLELRRNFSPSKDKDLPLFQCLTTEWFADNVVASPGGIKYPEGEARIRWGSVIREKFKKSLEIKKIPPGAADAMD